MKFTLTNAAEDLWPNKVRVSIDTDQDTALEILAAAREIHDNKPDPILEALKASLGGVITKEEARETIFRPPTYGDD
uniref:Uncharacterized protein n=1 Tax=Mycobacterium phage BabyBack TaxID=3158877 RepID=A0AAU8GTI5_9CAUD